LFCSKESFNSDGQQFLQYQQSKRKFEQLWSKIPPISTNQKKIGTVMVKNSFNINKTITVQTFFSFVDIGGIVDHHCLNILLVC
jgi:GTP-sensing pleiotropic transcriptional regulator CodY